MATYSAAYVLSHQKPLYSKPSNSKLASPMNPPPPDSGESAVTPRRGSQILVSVVATGVLVGVVVAVYLPAIGAPFIFDDAAAILENESIRRLHPLVGTTERPGPLRPPVGSPLAVRPLINASFAVNYHFGRFDPAGYRAVHLVAHPLAALILWRLVARLLRLPHFRGRFSRVAEPVAWLSALIWAVHPVNSETVVYLTQRTELFVGLAAFTAWYASLRYWAAAGRVRRGLWIVVAASASLAGMLSKEVMVPAVGLIPAFDLLLRGRSVRRAFAESWPLYVTLAISAVPLAWIYASGIRTPGGGFDMGVSVIDWWLTQARVLFLYLRLAVWPHPLQIHHHFPNEIALAEAWPWAVGTGVIVIGTVWLLVRRSAVGFAGLVFFAILSPTLLIPLPGEAAAERRMYIPLAAILPLGVAGGCRLIARLRSSRSPASGSVRSETRPLGLLEIAPVAVVATVLAGLLAVVANRRAAVYQNEWDLWVDVRTHQPDSPVAPINLGTILAENGDPHAALGYFRQAVNLAPELYLARFNFARSLEATGDELLAIEHYRHATRVRPEDAASHYNLGRLLETYGDPLDAIDHYGQAIEADPSFAAAHGNLAVLLFARGDPDEAIASFETAFRLQPDLPNAMNLVYAYLDEDRIDEAERWMYRAKRMAIEEGDDELSRKLDDAIRVLRPEAP